MRSKLLNSLFDDEERRPLTVSELNDQVKRELERRFSSVWVEGEIVNFTAAASGHWYFTLHDGGSQLRAACYVSNNRRISFRPFDGLQVRVRGKLTLYAPRGEYQILVDSLQPFGEGALKIAFQQIRSKLGKEGLFDEALKRRLPFLPRRVGVVTSPNGAAFHDILSVLSRRTRTVNISLIPTRVQGEFAGEEITKAIELANLYNTTAADDDKFDVLIVGRGGGSAEDLWAFNEEMVARAIRASSIPVISAVGHEIDFTIADLVADLSAPTPSAAAELVAESEDQIEFLIDQRRRDLFGLIGRKLLVSRSRLKDLEMSAAFGDFRRRVSERRVDLDTLGRELRVYVAEKFKLSGQRLDSLANRISPVKLAAKLNRHATRLAVLRQKNRAAAASLISARDEQLRVRMASLDALSPLSVLRRGYSIARGEMGEILRSVEQVRVDEEVKVTLAEGRIGARVLSIEN